MAAFDDFLVARVGPLSRAAYLLTGSMRSARSLLLAALAAARERWRELGKDVPGAAESWVRQRMIEAATKHAVIIPFRIRLHRVRVGGEAATGEPILPTESPRAGSAWIGTRRTGSPRAGTAGFGPPGDETEPYAPVTRHSQVGPAPVFESDTDAEAGDDLELDRFEEALLAAVLARLPARDRALLFLCCEERAAVHRRRLGEVVARVERLSCGLLEPPRVDSIADWDVYHRLADRVPPLVEPADVADVGRRRRIVVAITLAALVLIVVASVLLGGGTQP